MSTEPVRVAAPADPLFRYGAIWLLACAVALLCALLPGEDGAMLEPTRLYREAGAVLLPTQAVVGDEARRDFAGQLVLAPPSAMGSPWLKRMGPQSAGYVSGWMRLRGNRRRRNVDRGFVLSDHADWPGLLRSIADTGAREVLATHGDSHALVRWLRERGTDAGELRVGYEGDDA